VRSDQVAPDQGLGQALAIAVGVAAVSAIGAWALAAIGAAAASEIQPILASQADRFAFIGASARFSAEVLAGLSGWLSYRMARGLSCMPRKLSVLGLMGLTGALGLVAARFVALFSPWIV
jgi:hypothetical protein